MLGCTQFDSLQDDSNLTDSINVDLWKASFEATIQQFERFAYRLIETIDAYYLLETIDAY